MSKPVLKPVRSPQELRDRTIRDYANGVRRHGIEPDMRRVEQIALQDLHTVDAAKREGPGPSDPTPAKPRPKSELEVELEKERAEFGGSTLKQAHGRKTETDRAMRPIPVNNGTERMRHALGRIKMILSFRTDTAGLKRAVSSGGIEAALRETAIPHLAKELSELILNYNARALHCFREPNKHNPFAGIGKDDAKAWRILWRRIEDICDRSTGVPGFGPWYTR